MKNHPSTSGIKGYCLSFFNQNNNSEKQSFNIQLTKMLILIVFACFVFISKTQGQGVWKTLSPTPNGAPISDIVFVDNDNGYWVGKFGTIMKTKDGGASWKEKESNTFNNLNAAYALPTNDVVIVGDNGTIIKNEYGSLECRIIAEDKTATTENLSEVQFINDLVGYACGANGTIIKTTTGGETWTVMPTPEYSPTNPHPDLNSLYFIDENNGWAVSSVFYMIKTEDGGETWTKKYTYSLVGTLNCVFFTDNQTGYAAGTVDDPSVPWDEKKAILLRTTNGGDSWDEVILPNTNVHSIVYDMHFYEDNHGWLMLRDDGFQTAIYYTYNGTSWYKKTGFYDPDPPHANGAKKIFIKAESPEYIWAAGAEHRENYVYKYKISYSDLEFVASWSNHLTVSESLQGIAFLDENKTRIIDRSAHFYTSYNGGYAWSIDFQSDLEYFEGYSARISKSSNNSRWITLYHSPYGTTSGDPFSKIYLRNTTNYNYWYPKGGTFDNIILTSIYGTGDGYAVGKNLTINEGVIYFINSFNGIATLRHTTGSNVYLTDVHYHEDNDEVIIAVGHAGTIRKSVDYGENWSPITSGTASNLFAVTLITETVGWTVGSEGTILKTTDNGDTWVLQNSNTNKTLYDVFALSPDLAYACGNEGIVLKTIDGGANWTKEPVESDMNLNCIKFHNERLGYVVGETTIAKYFDYSPLTQGASPVLNSETPNTMKISWEISPDAEEVVVFMKEGTENAPAKPTHFVPYFANSIFGEGAKIVNSEWYCVYKGNGTSTIISGLKPSTTYQAVVLGYNTETEGAMYNLENNTAQATTLISNPEITKQPEPVAICEGGSIEFVVEATGAEMYYTWEYYDGTNWQSVPNGTGFSGDNIENSFAVSDVTAAMNGHKYLCKVGNAGGEVTSNGVTLTVNRKPATAGIITGDATVCLGNNNLLYTVQDIADAESYEWSLPAGFSGSGLTTKTISVNIESTATSGDITVRGINTCGIGDISTFSVAVSDMPGTPGTIAGAAPVCQHTDNVEYSVLPVSNADSYIWTIVGATGESNTEKNFISFGDVLSASISVKAQNHCGVSAESTKSITVNPTPGNTGTISGQSTVCQGDNNISYMVSSITGAESYIWELPPDASGNSVNSEISVSYSPKSISGNLKVKGHNSCGDGDFITLPVTVNSKPLAAGNITGKIQVCANESNVEYMVEEIENASTYIWTLPEGASGVSSSNKINVSFGANAISGEIKVKGINDCGEGAESALFVSIISLPGIAGEIAGASQVCEGQQDVLYSIDQIANASEYDWTFPSGVSGESTENTILLNFDESASSGQISVTPKNQCGISQKTVFNVTINDLPADAGTINGQSNVCLGIENAEYSISEIEGADSYKWSFPPTSTAIETRNTVLVSYLGDAVSGDIIVSGENVCGLGGEAILPITVATIPLPAGTISGKSTVCLGETNVEYSVDNIIGADTYHWTLPKGVTGTSSTNTINISFGENAVSGEIKVKGINDCGEGAESSINVSVKTIPESSGEISGKEKICVNEENILYTISQIDGATSYIWNLPSGFTGESTTNSIAIRVENDAMNGQITVSPKNECGAGTAIVKQLDVGTTPSQAGSISGNTFVCQGENEIMYSVETISGADYYRWTSPPNTSITNSSANKIHVDYGRNSISGIISVQGANHCGSGIGNEIPVTVNSLPAEAGNISGETKVCINQTNVKYSVAPIAGADSYIWLLPDGAEGTSSTNSINVSYTEVSQSGKIRVKGLNSCGEGNESSLFITVNDIPGNATSITGKLSVCQGENNVVYTAESISEASVYKWQLPLNATGVISDNRISVNYSNDALSGKIYVQGQNQCGTGEAVSVDIAVNSIPATPLVNKSGDPCTEIKLSTENQSDLSYQWIKDNNEIDGANSNNYHTVNSGIYKLKATNPNGCSNYSPDVNVKIYPKPENPIIQYTGETEFCESNGLKLTTDKITGFTYEWFKNNISQSNYNNEISAKTTGSYYVKATSENQCVVVSEPVSIKVNPNPEIPAISLQGDTEFCKGDNVLLYTSIDDNLNYEWLNLGETTENTTNKIEVSESGVYSLHVSNSFGCEAESEPVSITVIEVPQIPEISVDGSLDFCNGERRNLSAIAQEGINYQWFLNNEETDNLNTDFLATQKGKYTLKATNKALCSSEASINLQVYETPSRPAISLDGPADFCKGQILTLTSEELEGLNYQWRKNSNDIANAISGVLMIENAGNYSLFVENIYGCANQSLPVEVKVYDVPEKPIIEALAQTEFCEGNNVELSTASDENLSYTWLLNGESANNGNNHNYFASKTGNYTLKVKNSKGCEAELSSPIKVTVFDTPDKQAINMSGSKDFCEGSELKMSVIENSEYSYEWTKNNTLISTETIITTKEEAEYQLKITNTDGCSVMLDKIKVTVRPVPKEPQIDVLSTSTNICPDDFVDMQVSNQQDGIAYQWLRNGVEMTDETDIGIQTNQAGLYKIVAADMGCTNVSEGTEVSIKKAPDKPLLFAIGSEIYFLICTNIKAKDYKWYFNGEEIPEALYYAFVADNTPGEYYVSIYEGGECYRNSNKVTIPISDDKKSQYKALADEYSHLVEGMNGLCSVEGSVLIYPNPNNGMFNVDLSGVNETKFDIKVVDLSGRTVIRESIHKNAHEAVFEFDLQKNGKGIYYFIIESTDHKFVEKVMVY